MKKIALITDGWGRYVTYTWIQGYRSYITDHHSDIDLIDEVIVRARNCGIPTVSLLEYIPGMYHAGIDNYAAITKVVDHLILPLFQSCMQKNKPVGIMFTDADHLKYINDNFGHDMGNLAISSIASVLRQYCPPESVSIRYGGDEFVSVIPDCSEQAIKELIETVQKQLHILASSSRITIPIEASIGYVIADDPAISLNDYINLADEKMYSTKKARKAERRD